MKLGSEGLRGCGRLLFAVIIIIIIIIISFYFGKYSANGKMVQIATEREK